MTKRLFTLRNTKDGSDIEEFFTRKMDAKTKRKILNPKDEDGQEQFIWVVTIGPDHDRKSA